MKPIKILDIEIQNPSLINHSEIARYCKYTQSYVSQLLDENNVRKNSVALRKIRNAIVALYSNVVSIRELQHA